MRADSTDALYRSQFGATMTRKPLPSEIAAVKDALHAAYADFDFHGFAKRLGIEPKQAYAKWAKWQRLVEGLTGFDAEALARLLA